MAALGGVAPWADASQPRPEPVGTVWLCRPGLRSDPCTASLRTTVVSANGSAHVVNYRPATDCFYVYPNISHQRTTNATLHIDPQETAIAELEASPFSWVCRVFAPMYREVIPTGPEGGEAASIAYRSVLDAWRDYLDRYNDRRGVVLIGHSEGSGMLFQLIAREIDPDPSIRHRVVLATLLGLDMPVGVDGAGPFAHIGACGSSSTLGCVVGYNAYSQPPPPGSLFGRAVPSVFDGVEQKDLCTDPAALDGGAGTLISLYRTHLATQEVAGGTTEGVFGVH